MTSRKKRAERAPEGEVTAAVRAAAQALFDHVAEATQELEADGVDEMIVRQAEAHVALAAALDVEEVVGVLASHAAWRSYGQHGYGLECSCGVDLGKHSMAVNANDVHQRHQAEALRAAILGGAR